MPEVAVFWHLISIELKFVIRITIQPADQQTVVNIDGRVAESDLNEIRRIRKAVKGEVVLNLGGLDACAAGGVELLQSWLKAGALLQDATPFLRMILEMPPAGWIPKKKPKLANHI